MKKELIKKKIFFLSLFFCFMQLCGLHTYRFLSTVQHIQMSLLLLFVVVIGSNDEDEVRDGQLTTELVVQSVVLVSSITGLKLGTQSTKDLKLVRWMEILDEPVKVAILRAKIKGHRLGARHRWAARFDVALKKSAICKHHQLDLPVDMSQHRLSQIPVLHVRHHFF